MQAVVLDDDPSVAVHEVSPGDEVASTVVDVDVGLEVAQARLPQVEPHGGLAGTLGPWVRVFQ